MPEESITQLASGGLEADAFFTRMFRHVVAINEEFQIILTRQIRDELLVAIRLRTAQLVIEMNNRENDTQLAPQFEHQPQQRNRINPARNGDANALSGVQQLLPPNMSKEALRERMHWNMLAQPYVGTAALGCPRSEAPLRSC